MSIERIAKIDAAAMQLDAAAAAYRRGEFIPAITLAAAAEEVLARLLPADQQSSQDELIQKFEQTGISAKEARNIYLNAIKNALKHHSNSEQQYIDFDPEADARVWVTRALHNFGKLGRQFPAAVVEFICEYVPRAALHNSASNRSLEHSREP